MSNGTMSRRTVLRGLGVTMALPWLESMAWANPIDYLYKGDENRKLCSLYLDIMDRMGVKMDAFGDATTRLEGL